MNWMGRLLKQDLFLIGEFHGNWKILQDSSYLQQKRKFATQTNSNMLNSMMMFTFYVLDQKYPFWSKNDFFFKMEIGIHPNSNMLNLMVMFTFSISVRKCPFWANLVQNVKTVCLRWKLVPRIIKICWIRWGSSFVLFWIRNTLSRKIGSKNQIYLFRMELVI